MSMSYNYPPPLAYPSAPPVYRGLPAPPRLHWGWVLALCIVTFGLFGMVWMVVVGWWVKKATRNARPFWWSLAYMLVIPFALVLGFVGAIAAGMAGGTSAVNEFTAMASVLVRVAGLVLYVVAAFTTKSALEAQPIDIPLGGAMTFLFAPIYFQYNLYDYDVEGKVAEQLSGFASEGVAEAPPQA
jgi:hypothetical protein